MDLKISRNGNHFYFIWQYASREEVVHCFFFLYTAISPYRSAYAPLFRGSVNPNALVITIRDYDFDKPAVR